MTDTPHPEEPAERDEPETARTPAKPKTGPTAAVIAVVVVLACGAVALFRAVTDTPRSPIGADTPAATRTGPDQVVCQVTDGGVYYLAVTSAADHNFSACAAGSPYPGTVYDLLGGVPGVDRRCILGDRYTEANRAIVAVYSDTKPEDLAAARAFCDANGGT